MNLVLFSYAFGTAIARENLNAQTAILRKLLTDWTEQGALSTAHTALHLDNWKAELAEANTLFTERYMARLEEAATADPYPQILFSNPSVLGSMVSKWSI